MLIIIEETNIYFFIIAVVGVIIIGIIANYYSTKNIILRELKKSKRKSINRVKEGEYVKLVGTALGTNKLFISPLSQKECVFYHTLIEQEDDDSWSVYAEEKRHQDFFIKVNDELAIVKSTYHYDFKKVYVVFDYKKETKSSQEKTPLIEKFLTRKDKSSKTFLFGFKKLLRCSEGVIELNEKIAVEGIAKWKTLKEPIEGYSYSKILTIIGTTEKELLITDDPEALNPIKNMS